MKKFLAILLCFVTVFSITGCDDSFEPNEENLYIEIVNNSDTPLKSMAVRFGEKGISTNSACVPANGSNIDIGEIIVFEFTKDEYESRQVVGKTLPDFSFVLSVDEENDIDMFISVLKIGVMNRFILTGNAGNYVLSYQENK